MPPFLLIDPDKDRRAVLKQLLVPNGRVLEKSSLKAALTECQDQVFKATFLAWPQSGLNPTADCELSWSSEHLLLMLSNPSDEAEAKMWAGRFWRGEAIVMCWPLTIEFSRVLDRLFKAEEPTRRGSVYSTTSERSEPKNDISPYTESESQSQRAPDFPDEVDADGYRTLRIIRTTNFTRVFLAELKFTGDLVILKLLRPENSAQADAMRMGIALHKHEPLAEKVMAPIHHANTWSHFYVVVVACLDDVRRGRQIVRSLYRPHTFDYWLGKRTAPLTKKGREEVIDRVLEMVAVLDLFHKNDLVLNDIKPDNFGFYNDRLVSIDYGGITFAGQPPHEYNQRYGPQELRGEKREGKPAEDLYAVIQIMAQALYYRAWPPHEALQVIVPHLIEAEQERHKNIYQQLFDRGAWETIRKGLTPEPDSRYQDAPSLANALEKLQAALEEMEE